MRPQVRDLVDNPEGLIEREPLCNGRVVKRICTAGYRMFVPSGDKWDSYVFAAQRNRVEGIDDYFRCHFPPGLSTNVKLQVLAKAMHDLLVAEPDLTRSDCAGVLEGGAA